MAEPVKRRNPHRAVGESNQDAITRLAGERDAARKDADQLRTLGDGLAVAVEQYAADPTVSNSESLIDAVQAWRSATRTGSDA